MCVYVISFAGIWLNMLYIDSSFFDIDFLVKIPHFILINRFHCFYRKDVLLNIIYLNQRTSLNEDYLRTDALV